MVVRVDLVVVYLLESPLKSSLLLYNIGYVSSHNPGCEVVVAENWGEVVVTC
jgi:hypothetical protein